MAALLSLSFIAIYLSSVTATFRALSELARLNALQHPDTFTGVSVVPADTFARALILGPQIFTLHVPFNELNATLLFAMAIVAFVNATIAGYRFEDPFRAIPRRRKITTRPRQRATRLKRPFALSFATKRTGYGGNASVSSMR